MKPRKPLKRTSFRTKREGPSYTVDAKPRAERIAAQAVKPALKSLHVATMGGTTKAAPKPAPMLQHLGYMAAVRDLGYCMRCKRACRPQFCHRDMGKGAGLKTDCREGWPGCAECHYLIGSTGAFPREEKRLLELEYGRRTREAVKAAGTWPARCPQWGEGTR